MNIGFLGLGNMGGPMAQNLLKAGHAVLAFDLSAAAMQAAKEAGATLANKPQELAQAGLDIVFTMLPAAQHVRSVYLGEDGLLAHGNSKTLYVDCSTIDPHTAREVAGIAAATGITLIDAPVSGGTKGAAEGTLTFMVGGPENAFGQAQEALKDMGKNIVHCGDTGNGQVAK